MLRRSAATRARPSASFVFANETGESTRAISKGLGDALRARPISFPASASRRALSPAASAAKNAGPRTIAPSLDLGVLINGTLRRQGKTLDVLVEIVDEKGFAIRQPLSFQGAERELLKLQQQIAAEVGALLVPAARASLAPAAPPPTSQSESANRLVIFGSHYDHEVRDDITVDKKKLDKAINFYKRATVADPNRLRRTPVRPRRSRKGRVDEACAPRRSR